MFMKQPAALRPPPRRRQVSRAERRVTFALKVLALVVLIVALMWGVLVVIGAIRTVAIILVGAIFLTYMVHPLVVRLQRDMPLGAAIAITYAAIILLFLIAAGVVIPPLLGDLRQLAVSYPELVARSTTLLTDPHNWVYERLPQAGRDYVATIPAQLGTVVQKYGMGAASQAVGILLSTVSLLATVVVMPIISIYILLEGASVRRSIVLIVPPRGRPGAIALLEDIDKVFGGFIRGQILVGAIIGTLITIMLLIMHVRYAVLIGVMAGIFDLIPYVGSLVGFVPAVTLAWVDSGFIHALIVAGLFAAIFQLEGNFISPKIVSDTVGLSPLWVIIAIMVGGELLGIAGMFIAVPVAGMIHVVMQHFIPRMASAPTPPDVKTP